ncbi:MAG TPA: hypothetical protein VK589_05765 [Chryseolinea sp.]|nr:hypothetical protein [Chryseolinea sp.]
MSFVNSILNILRFNKKNWKAVVLCIFAATVFWFFNALNKSYSATVSFPLLFDYDHERYVPVRPLPQMVRLNVTGIGWNLFRRSVGVKVPPLVIPLDKPSDVKKIVGSTLPALFANQLTDFQINFVMTDTIRLAIEPKSERKVILKLDLPPAFFRDGYALISPIHITPDSVLLEGPQRLIKNLPDLVYLKISQRNIDENFTEVVEVRFLNDEYIKRNPATVDITFQVDKLVKKDDSVRLELINTPKHARPLIERKKIICTVAVPESMLNFYNVDSIRAVVDLENFSKGVTKVLPSLEGLPPFTKVLKVDSISIKF